MKKLLLIFIVIYFGISAQAQYGSFGVTDAYSLGMGNTYNATAYGLLSVGKNPGWLHHQDKDIKVSIIFPNLTAQTYGFNQAFSTFDYYFGDISKESINRLSDEKFMKVLDNNGKLFVDGLVGFLSVSYTPSRKIGTFAFTVSDYISAFLDIPNIVISSINNQEQISGTFSLDDFVYKTWWLRTFALSYSRNILKYDKGILKQLDGGITLKYIKGFAYQKISLESSVAFSNQNVLFNANIQGEALSSFSDELTALDVFNTFKKKDGELYWPKSASTAFGFDIGFGAILDYGIKIGISATDVGKVKWDQNSTKGNLSGSFQVKGELDISKIDSIATNFSYTASKKNYFYTPLPTAIRLGLAWQADEAFKKFPGYLLLGLDLNVGMNNEPSNFKTPRYSIGLEYHYWKYGPVLLLGTTYDQLNKDRVAIGVGAKTRTVDFYASTIDLIPIIRTKDRASIALVLVWKIRSKKGRKSS